MEIVVCGRYLLGKIIGFGAFGQIYDGTSQIYVYLL
jgi:hypothetical protein